MKGFLSTKIMGIRIGIPFSLKVIGLLLMAFLFVYDVAKADETITTTATKGTNITAVGYDDGAGDSRPRGANKFSTNQTGSISTIIATVREASGSPTDGVKIKIYRDEDADADATDETLLGTSAVAFPSEPTCSSDADVTFTFSPAIDVDINDFWIVLERDGALSNTDWYGTCGTTAEGTDEYSKEYSSVWSYSNPAIWSASIYVVSGGGGGTTSTTSTTGSNNQDITNLLYLFFISSGMTAFFLSRQ